MSALHPRFEAYGLTAADADLVNSVRFAARRAGWSGRKLEQAFEWFKDHATDLGRMTVEQRIASFQEFTAARGWRAPEVESALGWFGEAQSALDRGQAPPLPPAPTREQDTARRAEIDRLMQEDPDAYWRNQDVQDELYEINARADGSSAQPAQVAPPSVDSSGRRAEIEGLMKTSPDAYWRDPGVQAEYRALLGAGGEPAGDAVAGSAAPAGSAGVGGE